jgi:hypothetical protein
MTLVAADHDPKDGRLGSILTILSAPVGPFRAEFVHGDVAQLAEQLLCKQHIIR